jgi:hypothetical protein
MSSPRGRTPAAALVLAFTLVTILAAGCSSGGGSAASAAAATKKACGQVAAVLSDGPDPDADPAGYAEAQILPLRQIRAPGHDLTSAISALDAAYRQVFASNGKNSAATAAVAAASKKVNAICPGAAS